MIYKITSEFGFAFKRISYFPFVMIIVFIVFNFINYNLYGIIFLFFFLLIYFFLILRKVLKATDVSFDKRKIYFDDEEVLIEDVIAIEKDKIIFMKNGAEASVFFNSFLPDNIDFLKDIIADVNKPSSSKSE